MDEGGYRFVSEEDADPLPALGDPLAALTTSQCRVGVCREVDSETLWLSVFHPSGSTTADFLGTPLVLISARRSIALLDRLRAPATTVEIQLAESSVVVLPEHDLWFGVLPWAAGLRELVVSYKTAADDHLRTDTVPVATPGP